MDNKLQPLDYLDECCKKESEKKINIARILEKYDYYQSIKDQKNAENILLYWLKEAALISDNEGYLTILNELMGFYRLNNSFKALDAAKEALEFIKQSMFQDTLQKGTTLLNIGTVYKAFNKSGDAISYFEEALKIYQNSLKETDSRFAGLFNNYALALADELRFDEALNYYFKAIHILESLNTNDAKLEIAITLLNIATLIEKKDGLEQGEATIDNYLMEAWKIFSDEKMIHDSYFAFVASKCESVYRYYGYFIQAKTLNEWVNNYYERS